MCDVIKKRNGHKVAFDPSKILRSVERAYTSVECEMTDYVRMTVQDQELYTGCVTVDDISDQVSNFLFACAPKTVYDSYVNYRSMRAAQRKKKDYKSIINIERNDITNDNANMNSASPAGQLMKFATETTKQFAKEELLAPDVLEAMNANYIYVHDLDYYCTKSQTCLQTPFDKIVNKGFHANHGSARPCKRIESAAAMVAISMQTSQNEQHGGQAIPAIDFYLAPTVRASYIEELDKISQLICDEQNTEYWESLKNEQFTDYIYTDSLPNNHQPTSFEPGISKERIRQLAMNRTVKRVHQAMESLIHNLNHMHSRGGNQVVFSSINYGTDTSAEGRLIIRELLNCCAEGVGNGSTAIFPIHIFKCKAGVNKYPGDPNYDLYKQSWPVCIRRFFPNYLNLDASYNISDAWDANDPERYKHEVATMGCRTRIWSDRFGEPTSIGRGNLSFTSINLPKIAIEIAVEDGFYKKTKNGYELDIHGGSSVKERVSKFMTRLKKYADLVAKQLDDRYKFQETALAKQFPLVMSGLWMGSENLKQNDTVKEVLKHGTLGVSFIGLAEVLIMLTSKHHGEDEEVNKIGMDIIRYLDGLCKQYSEEYNHNYACFATPAEGLSGRFTVVDREYFGKIVNVTDKDFYTNSSHVPVWYQCTPQHKMEVECPYHKYEPAGHIAYVECDVQAGKNPEVVGVINQIAWDNDGGYISLNCSVPRCSVCSHEEPGVIDEHSRDGSKICPVCGGPMSTLDRVTGYLSSTYENQAFGKKDEIKHRVVHKD